MHCSPWDVARRYAEASERRVIGLMSGTSVDGVDAVLISISGCGRATTFRQVAFHTEPFPPRLRSEILGLSHGDGNAETVAQANVALAHLFGQAIASLLRSIPEEERHFDLIASHGQTVSHRPPVPTSQPLTFGRHGATLQIGDASYLAQRWGVPVIADFRMADMAVGGQGAPLVPFADWCLLTHPERYRAVQNIGGIANVTYLRADAAPEQLIGFDTGPGNMLIDRAVVHFTRGAATFDRNAAFARKGRIRHDLLEYLLNDPFLFRSPPKSAGREEFGDGYFRRLLQALPQSDTWFRPESFHDAIATLTAFTAFSIIDAYERFLPRMPDEVIVGGGGSRNPFLMDLLRERLAPASVLTHEEVGIDSDAKEAIAFALLANETMLGNPSNLPSVTGASRSVCLGKIALP
ncbi:MAG: anhydro-N-acetylmuramic acid kinase [Capsulimonadales bacterium]|nr:anhydro-N-acetylmuramic acid kinase [Capsulimonadales bacterium]